MRKLFLLFTLLVLFFPSPKTSFAQEACTYKCPSGMEFTDAAKIRCKFPSSDLTILSTSQCEAGKIPTSPEYSDSCTCNAPATSTPEKDTKPKSVCPTGQIIGCPEGTQYYRFNYCKVDINNVNETPVFMTCVPVEAAPGERPNILPGQPGYAGVPASQAQGIHCNPANGQADNNGAGILTAIGCIPTEPQSLITDLLRYGTLAGGGIAFLIMIIAALQMITAEGNPNTIKTSQEKFYSAIIGLLLIIFSVLLLQVIGVDLLGLKGFQ